MKVYALKTEHNLRPQAIDNPRPRLSWKILDDRRGVVQTHYRVIVKTAEEILWDSGKTAGEMQQVVYAGKPLVSRMTVFWRVELWCRDEEDREATAKSEWATFVMGLLKRSDWVAKWIEPEDEIDLDARKPSPYLRRRFSVTKRVRSGVIYCTAHGLYELWINGICPTKEKFKPGLTSYYYRIQYQRYDITDLLHEGENVWAVSLGDGWWRGVTGGTVNNNFGYKLHYFGQIELVYEDGTTETIGTDESFKASTGGLLASDMQMGELYDAAKEPKGWRDIAFDDSGWKNVHLTDERTDASLIASRSVPVLEKEAFSPVELCDADGERILDFGQNFTGYVHFVLRNTEKGQRVTLTHGEDLKDGKFSLENIRDTQFPMSHFQEITYICEGKEREEYTPRFAVFGFRYAKITGYREPIQKGDFTGIALYSDMERVGEFSCSDQRINRLVENSLWSQKSNFLDVAVDCPTRERNAWTGDAQIYVRTATDFMDVYSFFEKWLSDQTIEQYASGKVGITFPATSNLHNREEFERVRKNNSLLCIAGPEGNGNIGEDSAGWGDSAAWIPYILYLCYGDKQILQNQYETAKKWVDYMLRCAKEHNPLYSDQPQYHTSQDGELDGEYIYDTHMHYGEWMEPIAGKKASLPPDTDKRMLFELLAKRGDPLVATAYMCRSAQNVSQMAGVLGNEEDHRKYRRISERIAGVYEKYLIQDDGTIERGHQAPYVRALAFGLCGGDKRKKVLEKLVEEIEANGFKLNTGFLSTPFLLPVLAENGYTELAYRLLEQDESPSWLNAVGCGATTIPEKWDGFQTHEGSLNHYSYGAVSEFLFAYTAGIIPIFEKAGYREFILQPYLGGHLTFAKASFDSPYGTICSQWERRGEEAEFRFLIPANTFAKIILPDGSVRRVGSGEYRIRCHVKQGILKGRLN